MKTNVNAATVQPAFSLNHTLVQESAAARPSKRRRFLWLGGSIVTLILILLIAYLLLTNLVWTGLPNGQAAPNFSGEDLQGNHVQLSDYRGRPVMLTFWSPECFACREELPSLKKIAQQQGSDVVLLTVVSYPTAAEVKTFVKEQGITFPVIMDDQAAITALYHVDGIPFTYFIGPDGQIQQKAIGAGEPGDLGNNLTAWLKTCSANTVCK